MSKKSICVRIEWYDPDGQTDTVHPRNIADGLKELWAFVNFTVTEIPSGPVDCVKMLNEKCQTTGSNECIHCSTGCVEGFLREKIQPALDAARDNYKLLEDECGELQRQVDAAYQRGRDGEQAAIVKAMQNDVQSEGFPMEARSLPTEIKSSLNIQSNLGLEKPK